MRIIEINSFNFGSTGKIMLGVAECATQNGDEVRCCIPKERLNVQKVKDDQIVFGSFLSRHFHLIVGRLTGIHGLLSCVASLRLVSKLKAFNPDIVHLHNLHNCYINFPIFFRYIKKYNIPVVWTLHDCWSFTAYCPYFDISGCGQWKTGCWDCIFPQKEYPYGNRRLSSKMWRIKKKWFSGVNDLTIVTPSIWLSKLVEQSFLGSHSIKVINNGVDLTKFKTIKSNFREKLGISEDEKVVLGVAFDWNYKKGLDVFIRLSEMLSDKYRIVMVGTNETIREELPKRIIAIDRTLDQTELAEIYSAANVFVNPTREDNFPTVNIESLACGTPVVTFDSGGSAEIIDSSCGVSVPRNDLDTLIKTIENVCEQALFSKEACLNRAQSFDKKKMNEEYVRLFHEIEHRNSK